MKEAIVQTIGILVFIATLALAIAAAIHELS